MMQTQFGRYQVLLKLGQGAMSAVFLARDPFLSRLVAVKVLHPDLLFQKAVLDRFFKEAKTVSRIHSPNVVNIFDFGMEGRTPYLVMEFIDGQTLQKVMDQLQGEPMDPVVACAMIAQVVEGLGAASEWGIVHRDLKPENLMLTQKGHLKVTDFGICHLKDHTMTVTGQVLGSPRFMSPEQVKGVNPLSVQSDMFSVGAVFYYMLAGVPPFMAETIPDLYRQIVDEPHTPLSVIKPGLDRGLARLVDTLLEKDPAKRGQGPTAALLHLKKYLLKKKVIAPVDRIGEYVLDLAAAGFRTTSNIDPEQVRQWMGSLDLGKRPVRFSRRRKVVAAGISILVLGLGAGLISLLVLHDRNGLSISPPQPIELEVITGQEKPRSIQSPEEVHQPRQAVVLEEAKPLPATYSSADTISELETSKPDTPDSKRTRGPAFLTIESVPPFAEVFLDGYLFGRTPMEDKSCPPGKYRLTLKSKFGMGVDTLIQVNPGNQALRFVLMDNPESVGSN